MSVSPALRMASAGRPRAVAAGHVAADADVHAIALALDAPAVVERGEAPGESWHVVFLAPRGMLAGGDGRWTLRWGSREMAGAGRSLDALRSLLEAIASPPPAEALPFAGGVALMLSHALGHEIERLPATVERRDAIPWLVAIACPAALLLPVGGGEARLAWLPDDGGTGERWGLDEDEALELGLWCEAALRDPARAARGKEPPGRALGPAAPLWTRADHEAGVREVIRNLRAGEIYQANLTQRFEAPWEGSALGLHRILRRMNPSPFSGWMRDPGGAWEVVSGSPERALRRQGARLLTQPIKGTAPLPDGPATSPADAARRAAALSASEKDRAEHVMIVDLHRNDLGRVSVAGSVRVGAMMRLDRRSHVIQAIADIEGVLEPGRDVVDIIEAMFPAGSVTGVPKIRAMEILDGLERWDRGPYTGSFGFASAWGDMDLNVLIRSAWRSGERLAFAAGGGIVLDSDPAGEYEESLAKAEALRLAIEELRAR